VRILVVEDEQKVAKALKEGLEAEHYDVTVARTGEEGFFLVSAQSFDLVVLDLMLPGRDGIEVLTTLRKRGLTTPVLILTAKDAVEDRVLGLDSGADDYLVKPFAFEELLARVRSLVRRRYQDKDAAIQIGDLRIDTSAQRVWRGREEIGLTPREFALLEYLARRAGQVVSRSDVWEHVYDFHSEASSNVVDVYVSYLRRKLRDEQRPGLIQTVRGRGYCLVKPD